jgi:hypothetical protein
MEKTFALFRNLLIASLLLTPAALALMLVSPSAGAVAERGWQTGALYNGGEILIYFLAVMMVFRRAELLMSAAIAVGLAALRAIMCAVAGLLAAPLTGVSPGDAWLFLWAGAPHLAALQTALSVMLALPVLGFFLPSWVGAKPREAFAGAPGGAKSGASGSGALGSGGAGSADGAAKLISGYIQFNTYRDLEEFIEKTPALLGYALATDEGLIVSSDGRRLPFPLEPTTPRLQAGMAELAAQQRRCGMFADLLWQVSADHTIVYISLKPCFYLVLFFAPEAPLDEVSARVAAIRKSAEAFLVDRHRALAEAVAAKSAGRGEGRGEATAA